MLNSAPLLYWIEARDAIRLKRLRGEPGPWTDDPILSKYRFCNVRRQHDRVSQWIISHILHPYANHENLWLMAAIARYVNWTPTLQEIMDAGLWPSQANTFHFLSIAEVIEARTARGEQAWTGAYMIRAESNPNAEWYNWSKARYVMEKVIKQELWDDRLAITKAIADGSLEGVHATICGRYGWGSFMTGQLVADLSYAPPLWAAPDLYTWAPLGPGSRRGLNRLAGRPLDYNLQQAQAVEEMRELRFDVICELGVDFDDLTLHDIQNCLCEVDKYLRVQNGEGRPRSHFVPTN